MKIEKFTVNMDDLKDRVAKESCGITKQDAIRQGICIHCKQEAGPKISSSQGRMEYNISGMCEVCFDKLTAE